MSNLFNKAQGTALELALNYVLKDPARNLPRLVDAVEKLDVTGEHAHQLDVVRPMAADPENNWNQFVVRLCEEIDHDVLKTTVRNFFLNASVLGLRKQAESREKYGCNVPWAILMDPTSACNLHCTGCWAAEYGNKLNMSYEELDSIINQANELGTYFFLYSGGEPLVRKKDIIRLCEAHPDCQFTAFTNGTLIDEEWAAFFGAHRPRRINITLYGASDETYGRLCRNPQGFTQVTKAIRLLKEAGILVKLNCSVTPYNAEDLEQIFAFAEKEELVVQATSYMFPPLRRDASKVGWNDRFSAEESAIQEAWINVYQNGRETFLKHMESEEMASLSGDIEEDCMPVDEEAPGNGDSEKKEGERIRCRAGKCSFWVTWDGRFLPCGMLPGENALNVFEAGFDAAWEQAKAEAAAIRLPVRCSTCSLKDKCRACAAMVYTESGNYHDVPVYRCQMAHAYAGACRQVEEELRREALR